MVPVVRITNYCPICPREHCPDCPDAPDCLSCECDTQIAGHQMVVIEGGQMLSMRKDPRFLRFQSWADLPTNALPEDACVTTIFAHYDCFISNCGTLDDEIVAPDDRDSRHCDACRRCLDLGHRVYQVTVWCPEKAAEVENGNPEYTLDATCEKLILCPSCIRKILGEGDEAEGDVILYERTTEN